MGPGDGCLFKAKWTEQSLVWKEARRRPALRETRACVPLEMGPSSSSAASLRANKVFFSFFKFQFERPQVIVVQTKPTDFALYPNSSGAEERLPWGGAVCAHVGEGTASSGEPVPVALAPRASPFPALRIHLPLSPVDCGTVGMARCFWYLEFKPIELQPTAWPSSRRP